MCRPSVGKRTLTLMLLFAFAGCPERIKKVDPPPPDPKCGDELINATIGEECEGSNLNEQTCKSLGFDEGTLGCDIATCKFVKTSCVKRCGNGVLDTGEVCDGTLGVPGCSDFGYVSCSPTCTVDRAHCVTAPYQASTGALMRNPGGPTTLADLQPHGLGDLVMVVEDRFRVETFSYTVQQGFGTVRTVSFSQDPVAAIATGDDLVALNRDGTLDRYRDMGASFALEPFPDAGCSGVLVGELQSDAGVRIATSSCDGGELLVWSVGQPVRTALNGGVCAIADVNRDGQGDVLALAGTGLELHLAPAFAPVDAGVLPLALVSLVGGDFDDDGDLDLAGISGGSVKVLENTGAAYADRLTLPAPAAHELRAADLDLDGRVDLVWESGDKAQVRRNQGSWVFAPFEATFGTGPALSFSVGDVDGDGDLDLVSTRTSSGTATVSFVQLNRVR